MQVACRKNTAFRATVVAKVLWRASLVRHVYGGRPCQVKFLHETTQLKPSGSAFCDEKLPFIININMFVYYRLSNATMHIKSTGDTNIR